MKALNYLGHWLNFLFVVWRYLCNNHNSTVTPIDDKDTLEIRVAVCSFFKHINYFVLFVSFVS